ncbi:MAG TPA: DinB family protein [Thermomicrobiales bacterium]|nr:DinB family protein [Thermomicrobiales bacterium]
MTPEDRSRLIEQYANGPEALREAYDAAPGEMRDWQPAPGEWSVNEIICHCADAEMLAAIRIRILAVDPDPHITAMDQDAWGRTLDYSTRSVDDAFAVIEAVRRWTTPLLNDIPDEVWTKIGHHSVAGDYTANAWLTNHGAHLQGHVKQIEDNIAAWKNRE